MNRSKGQVFRLVKEIYNHLPENILKNFFNSQESSLYKLFTKEQNKINKKIKWLALKQHTKENNTNTPHILFNIITPS